MKPNPFFDHSHMRPARPSSLLLALSFALGLSVWGGVFWVVYHAFRGGAR